MLSKQTFLGNQIKRHLPTQLHDFFKRNHVYLVGGCIRDLLLSRHPVDYDLAVAQNAQHFAHDLGSRLGAHVVALGPPDQPLYRVWSPDTVFDVSPLTGGSIEADLGHRDFTINAMAWAWNPERLINGENGLRDLARMVVRMVSPSAFSNDPVRLLRAYRIAAELNFRIGARTREAIASQSSAIRQVAGERIRTELVRWLKNPHVHQSQRQMMADNLLGALFPHLCLRTPQDCPTDRGVGNMYRAIETTGRLEAFLAGDNSLLPSISDFHPDFPASDQTVYLKIAVLYGGLNIDAARKSMEKMRFSNKEKDLICRYLKGHLHLMSLFRTSGRGPLSKERMADFYLLYHGQAPYLLLRFLAEAEGDHVQRMAHSEQCSGHRFHHEMWKSYYTSFGPGLNQPPLISGKELIEYLNTAPSPTIGILLKEIRKAQISGSVTNRIEALKKARQHLKKCVFSRAAVNDQQGFPE